MDARIRERGLLSLVEMFVILMIFAILMTFGLPSLRHWVDGNEASVDASDFFAALQYARYLAVTHGERFGVCPRASPRRCAQAANQWRNGWLVFEARDVAGVCATPQAPICVPGHGRLFRSHEAVASGGRVHANHNVAFRIFFNRQGMSPGYNGRLEFCPGGHGDHGGSREIVLSSTGRPRWGRGSVSYCSSL